jgi:hypothetical protein
MKRILIDMPGMGDGRLFSPASRDNCCQPFIYLRNSLRVRGYALETLDERNIEGSEAVWFWDVPDMRTPPPASARFVRNLAESLRLRRRAPVRPTPYDRCVAAGLSDRMVLFLGEPPVVLPRNWDPAIHQSFRTIFTWHDAYVDGKRFHKFFWPQTSQFPKVVDVPFSDRKLLVNISGNKSSDHPQELYTARRDTIRHFEQHHPADFDLFGLGWNDPQTPEARYPSYRGTVTHKWDVYPRYRFGVCYENMEGEPGWVTEKIFDCMRAGCVPIYWGAPNIDAFVDAGTFVDRRRFASDAALAEFLLAMSEGEHASYRRAIHAYLESDRFAAFLAPAFAANIIKVLSL